MDDSVTDNHHVFELNESSIRKAMINSDSDDDKGRINSEGRPQFSVDSVDHLAYPKITVDTGGRANSQASVANSLTKKVHTEKSDLS
jgi:hypothetical protein